MKFFKKLKDGGPESTVTGYFAVEIKGLFSVVLLHFAPGTRPAFHSHAFHCMSWVLRGKLQEQILCGPLYIYRPSIRPVITYRSTFHQVSSIGHSWVLSFRGPWRGWWEEFTSKRGFIKLTHGRREV